MHIHGMGMNHNLAGLNGTFGAENAAAAERAADVRKRLLRAGSAGGNDAEDSFAMLFQADNQAGVTGVERYPYSSGGRDPDLG
jgi:hypothetical protein